MFLSLVCYTVLCALIAILNSGGTCPSTTESRSYFAFGAVTAVLGVVTSSEVSRPDLHLGAFGGVVSAFPLVPVHAVSERRVITVVVLAVQVGGVAVVVPPGAFTNHGAVPPIILVVVSVLVVKAIVLCHPSESPAVPEKRIWSSWIYRNV